MNMEQVITIMYVALIVWVMWTLKALDGRSQNRLGPELAEASIKRGLEPIQKSDQSKQKRERRGPQPRTPEDCPHCCAETGANVYPDGAQCVIPYSQLKSKRGRPKKSVTEGFACHDPQCPYRYITSSQIHAMVEDGDKLTQQGLVKQLKCQWCKSKFLVTRDTAMRYSKLSVERVGEINRGLAEGLSISACARVFGHSRSTIHRIARVSGEHFVALHELLFKGIEAFHVQMDELRTKLKGKAEAAWVWTSMEVTSKLLLAVHVGRRTQKGAHTLVHQTVKTLAQGCVPVFATDGLKLYFYALTAHFGRWLDPDRLLPPAGETGQKHRSKKRKAIWQVNPDLQYGQVIKRYARRKLKSITRKILLGSQQVFSAILESAGLSGLINTSYIERLNLGLRTGVSALIRRSASTVCSETALTRRIEIYRAIYHFVRPHASLRTELSAPQLCARGRFFRRFDKRTPAMAAGLTDRSWSMDQLLLHPVPAKPAALPLPPRLSSPVR